MKVLLIKPHVPRIGKGQAPPLGLGYIASSLLLDEHEVRIEDLTLYDGNVEGLIKNKIKNFSPDIVGITCNSSERFYAFDVARWVKEVGDIKVVMGGIHVTFTDVETLNKVPFIDVIVRHDGEITMRELCDKLQNKESIENVNGISYRDNSGHIYSTCNRPLNTNLDSLPFPARNLMEMEKYDFNLKLYNHNPKITTMIYSRGCPFKCNFCSATIFAENRVRFRSVENCVDEMEEILNDFPFLDGIAIMDDFFLSNSKRVIKICEEIKKRNLDFDWYCWGRVDSINNKELVQIMKSAGCKVITLGIESGSSKVLKAMNKKATPKQAVDAVKIIKEAGLTVRASFIFNYPNENFLDVIKTYSLIKRSGLKNNEITSSPYPILYPKTELFEILKQENYLPNDFNWEDHYNIPNYNGVPMYVPPSPNFRNFFRKILGILYRINLR